MALTCVLAGSLRRHLAELEAAACDLERLGVRVLSPRSFQALAQEDGFVFLAGDQGPAAEIQARHLAFIKQADFLLLVCPDGQVGTSATLEVGYAVACNKPVLTQVRLSERVLADLVEVTDDLPGWLGQFSSAR